MPPEVYFCSSETLLILILQVYFSWLQLLKVSMPDQFLKFLHSVSQPAERAPTPPMTRDDAINRDFLEFGLTPSLLIPHSTNQAFVINQAEATSVRYVQSNNSMAGADADVDRFPVPLPMGPLPMGSGAGNLSSVDDVQSGSTISVRSTPSPPAIDDVSLYASFYDDLPMETMYNL